MKTTVTIGSLINSVFGGLPIVVTKIGEYFIMGYELGAACEFPQSTYVKYRGYKIVSYQNIKN